MVLGLTVRYTDPQDSGRAARTQGTPRYRGRPVSDQPPQSSIILYRTDDGRSRIECRFENETLWLSQALIAELFDKDVRTVSEHLANIFAEGELEPEATVRRFRIVRQEGLRQVVRDIEHYSLPAILAVCGNDPVS